MDLTAYHAQIGWDNGRVPVPADVIDCPNMGAFTTQLARALPGGDLNNQVVKLHLSNGNVDYGAIGIRNYNGPGLEIYGNEDGSTVVRAGAGGSMAEANFACFRLGSADGARQTNRNVSIYNLDLRGGGSLGTTNGVNWGVILGGAFDTDENRGNVFNIHVQGVRASDVRQEGFKVDGNGGTDGVTVQQCTVRRTGLAYTPGTSDGFGEAFYWGDGNSGRPYFNGLLDRCHAFDVTMGEGVEFKRGGTNNGVVDSLFHDILIDNGGAIKFEDNDGSYFAHGNIVYNVSSTPDSDHEGVGILLTGGGNVTNNIVWNCERACSAFVLSQDPGLTSVLRHNTMLVGSAEAAYAFTLGNFGDGSRTHEQTVTVIDDIVNGTESANAYASATFDTQTATFVGPTTGTADAGTGPGSGFFVSGGAARNAVASSPVTADLRGLARTFPTDAGALDSDVTDAPPPPAAFRLFSL